MSERPLGAFAWLVARGFRNRMARRLRRVREPRYAIAMVVGLGYFWFIFVRPGGASALEGAAPGGGQHLTYALALTVLVASWWLMGGDKAALVFTPAEVQLLFPAPVTRRQLIEYKLLRSQLLILFSTVLWLFLLGRTAGSLWLRGIALWVIFTTLHLHRVGASLVRASAAEHGAAGVRRNIIAIVIFGAAAAAVLWSVVSVLPALRARGGPGGPGHTLASLDLVLHAPAMRAVLFPFRLLLAPLFTTSTAAWARAIGPALLLLVAHYPWVLRSDVAFEEAAAGAATKRAGMVAAWQARGGGRRVSRRGLGRMRFPLAAAGRRDVAIVWKNATAIARTLPIHTIIAFVGVAVLALLLTVSAAPDGWSAANQIGMTCLVFAVGFIIMGPLWVRNDLRLDLLQLELLRAYPLRGTSIVRAELAASTMTVAALQFVLILIAFATLPLDARFGATFADRTGMLVATAFVLPGVDALALAIQNGGALLWPAWMRLGLSRPGGVEAMGQGIVTTLGAMIALLVLLIVPLAAGGALAIAGLGRLGTWGLVPGAVLAAAMIVAELVAITAWLGGVFERTEPLGDEAAAVE